MLLFRTTPRIEGIPAVEAPGDAPELLLNSRKLAQRDRQKPFVTERHAVFELQLLFETFLAQPERELRARRQVVFEVVDVALDRSGRLGGRVGEVAENMEVIERCKGPWKIGLDEPQNTPPGLQADFDVDARAVLDVVLRGLHQPRHLPQLRYDPSGALGLRRVGEEGLPRETGADDLGVHLGIAVPGPDDLQLVHPGFDVRRDDWMLDLFDRGEERRVYLAKATAEPRQRADVSVDGGATQVLEQVVMDVNTVQPRMAG